MDAWSPLVNRLRELGNPRFSEESLFEKMRQRMMEKDIRHQSVSGLRTHMCIYHTHSKIINAFSTCGRGD